MSDILEDFRRYHEFKSEKEKLKFHLAQLFWADRAEYFFCDPNNPGKPLVLYPEQRQVIFALQFGLDTTHPEYPPTIGSLIHTRRQKLGKSVALSAGTAAGMLDGKRKFGLYAHSEDKAYNLMDTIQYFIKHSVFEDTVIKRSMEHLNLNNYSKADTHASSATSIEGDSYHYGAIDEAGLQKSSIIRSSIMPCFSELGLHWVMIGVPKGMQGVFYEFYTLAQADITAGKFPRYQIIYLDPIKSGRVTQEQLDREKDEFGVFWAQEALGLFMSAEGLFFKEPDIQVAMGNVTEGKHPYTPYHNSWNNYKPGVSYSIGIDFGLSRSMTVFVVAHKEGNLIYIDYIHVFKGAKEYLPILEILERDWMPYWRPSIIVPDATGIGKTNAEIITRIVDRYPHCEIYNKNPKEPEKSGLIIGNNAVKQELMQHFGTTLLSKRLVFPSDFGATIDSQPGYDMYELKKEMLAIQFEQKGQYIIFSSLSENGIMDRTLAISMAIYPFRNKPRATYTPAQFGSFGYAQYRDSGMERPLDLLKYDEFGRSEFYERF
jgi:hypothetical protein